jgi:hypothetical protein
MMSQTDPGSLEAVFRGWQQTGAKVAVSCIGPGMRVVFTGRIGAARKGAWTIGNGRAGLVFDIQYATGHLGDPAAVPPHVRECIDSQFVRTIELLLETGDECWFGEIRMAETVNATT